MCNINDNAVHGHLSENYIIIARNIMKYQGLYIIFQVDWKRARRPITKYTFPFLPSSLRATNIASGKKLQRLLRNINGGRPDNGVSVCEGVYSKP